MKRHNHSAGLIDFHITFILDRSKMGNDIRLGLSFKAICFNFRQKEAVKVAEAKKTTQYLKRLHFWLFFKFNNLMAPIILF